MAHILHRTEISVKTCPEVRRSAVRATARPTGKAGDTTGYEQRISGHRSLDRILRIGSGKCPQRAPGG
ncbi:hypothetical protein GCM10010440_62930 [Kitasatospora cinereorecta]